MGNEASQLNGLEIEEKAIELTDFWAHHQATFSDSCRYFSLKSDGSVSVFKGEAVLGPLWAITTPLEKCSNNLLKYRHPCILRYITAWQQRSTLHLATEYVQPLSHILGSQTPLQICIGLNNILEALVFLHDQAKMSHNNVSVSAVFVTGDGQWKLGGLQYLCNFKELTPAYLKHARIHRYDKAVDPNEASYETTTKVDQYAFAALVEDVYRGRSDDDVPHLHTFKKYCTNLLQHSNPEKRPRLSEVLRHDFFNHEFITIYKFLTFLPLKTEEEKEEFFSNILENLKCYDEVTVAKQLGGLFLSRLTMLDQTARKDVIPFIFKPRNERTQNGEQSGFFSLSVFKEHIKPRLMQLFAVRDTQIRMLLLTHFSKYVHVFTHDELSQYVLPELLLGIKDTDDNLVSSTLICLSELVPILGADTVVGGKRSKHFTDGRPNNANLIRHETNKNTYLPSKPLKEFSCTEEIFRNCNETVIFDKALILHERPSPVGGESIEGESNINIDPDEKQFKKLEESEDDWDDWDNSNRQLVMADVPDFIHETATSNNFEETEINMNEKDTRKASCNTSIMHEAALQAKKNIVDISELDIKNQRFDHSKKGGGDDFDFFADMMPVIEKAAVVTVDTTTEMSKEFSNKLNFVPNDGTEGDWGENWND